jgi:hypothetical protein
LDIRRFWHYRSRHASDMGNKGAKRNAQNPNQLDQTESAQSNHSPRYQGYYPPSPRSSSPINSRPESSRPPTRSSLRDGSTTRGSSSQLPAYSRYNYPTQPAPRTSKPNYHGSTPASDQAYRAEPFQYSYPPGTPGRYPQHPALDPYQPAAGPQEYPGYNVSRYANDPRDNYRGQLQTPNYHHPGGGPADYNYPPQLQYPQGYQGYQREPTMNLQSFPPMQIQQPAALNRNNQDFAGMLMIPQTRNVDPQAFQLANHPDYLSRAPTWYPGNIGNPSTAVRNPQPWPPYNSQQFY